MKRIILGFKDYHFLVLVIQVQVSVKDLEILEVKQDLGGIPRGVLAWFPREEDY